MNINGITVEAGETIIVEKESTDPTGDTTSPVTGDDSNIALWIGVLLAAGAALTGTCLLYTSSMRKISLNAPTRNSLSAV